MTERLLQFIWQFQYFNQQQLSTSSGEALAILHPGNYNTDQGPDFLQARVRIDKTIFAGTIELHIKTSDWKKHKHDLDANYKNVILHVVWEHDLSFHPMPLLVLQHRVSSLLLSQYDQWMQLPGFIPCRDGIAQVNELVWMSWKERLLLERLSGKAAYIKTLLEQNKYHWEETLWWMLARNFGVKVNSDSFESIARTIPVSLLYKIKTNIHQVESLLLGQAGLLNRRFEEDYPTLLQREYKFLQKKHKLPACNVPVFFLRMRPVNFPTIRLAQLAMLIHQQSNLFARIKEMSNLAEVKSLFDVCANDYWHYHYVFDETSAYQPKNLGSQIIGAIICNTICPLLFAYGEFTGETIFKTRAVEWYGIMPAEVNRITKGFSDLGVSNKTSADSQALIELKTLYCDHKRCLECSIGNSLLGKTGC